jgi:flagellar hook protein FlgE
MPTNVRHTPADIPYMDASSVALQGLQQADTQLDAAASAIANAGNSASAAPVDVVDLSAEMVALMSAQNSFEVNLATLKTADQMQKSLIDVRA